ncbi:MAG: hypothetical protein ACR2OU_06125 [Thermomicrobiales bacterium]
MPDFRKTSFRFRASTTTTSVEERASRYHDLAETPLNIDTFDEALDRLATGDPAYHIADPDLAALVDSAKHVQLDGGSGDTESRMGNQTPGISLSQEQKQSIWEDVMRSQQEVRPLAGVSRSGTSVVNARSFSAEHLGIGSAEMDHSLPTAGQRPSPIGWLRARIDIQPVVTTLLVAALLVAIVAGYRGFGGGSGALVTPTASAHGDSELAAAAIGSPVSSPEMAFACDVSSTPIAQEATSQSESYGYEKRGPISEAQAAAIPGLMGPFVECMYRLNYQGLGSVATGRFVTGLQHAVSGTPEDTGAIQLRSSALKDAWSGPLPAGSDPVRIAWKTSNGTVENFNLFLDTAQRLDDGRIGMLATVAPVGVSPVPDETWDDSAMLSVWFIGFQETGAGLRVDELFGMCGGSECVPLFGADAATPEASPVASSVASPVVRP